MAPSRGAHLPSPSSSSTTHIAEPTKHDDHAITQQSNSALKAARRNFNYLLSPTSTNQPTRFRTRALLRTLRYVSQFVFWRVVRWAKYAAVAALVAGISATAFGSVITGAAWIAAPPTIGASVLASVVWGMGKYLARKANKRWERTGRDEGQIEREKKEDGVGGVRGEGSYGLDVGPSVVPW